MPELDPKLRNTLTVAWADPRVYLPDLASKGAKSAAFQFIAKKHPGITLDEVTAGYAAWQRERKEAFDRNFPPGARAHSAKATPRV